MLMRRNNYSVNEICSHSGSTANELAVIYIALMVTVGRQRGGGLAVKEACSAVLPLCPQYSRDEVAPSILLAPSKEQAHLAAEPMTDGSRRELFSAKGRDPWLSDLRTELPVSEGAATPSRERVQIHREDDVMQYGLLLSQSFLLAADARLKRDSR